MKKALILLLFLCGCVSHTPPTINQINERTCESLSVNFKLKKIEVVSTDSDKYSLKLHLFGENYYYECCLESEITKNGKDSDLDTFLKDFNKSKRLGKYIYITLSDPSIVRYNKIDFTDLK